MGSCDLSTSIRRGSCDPYTGLPSCLHERGTAGLGLVVDIGVPVHEQLDHTLVPLPAGQGQWSVVVAARGNVDLGTRVQEQLCGFIVALPAWNINQSN